MCKEKNKNVFLKKLTDYNMVMIMINNLTNIY